MEERSLNCTAAATVRNDALLMQSIKGRYFYKPEQVQASHPHLEIVQGVDSRMNNPCRIHFCSQIDPQHPILPGLHATLTKLVERAPPRYLPCSDVLVDQDRLVYVTEMPRGASLLEVLGKSKFLHEEQAMYLLHQMASVLSALHKLGVPHGFVNLENFVVTQDGLFLTHSHPVLKLFYLSPEFRLDRICSPEGDWFSLGVCLHKMLFGLFPFDARTPEEFVANVKESKFRQKTLLSPVLPFQVVISDSTKLILSGLLDFFPTNRTPIRTDLAKMQLHYFSQSFRRKYLAVAPSVDGFLFYREGRLYQAGWYDVDPGELPPQYLQSLKVFDCEDGVAAREVVPSNGGVILVQDYSNMGPFQMSEHAPYFLVNAIRSFHKHFLNHGQIGVETVLLHQGKLRIRCPRPFSQATSTLLKAQEVQVDQYAPQFKAQNQKQLAIGRADVWSLGYLLHICLTGQKPCFDGAKNYVKSPDIPMQQLLEQCLKVDPQQRADIFDLVIESPDEQVLQIYYQTSGDHQNTNILATVHPAELWKYRAVDEPAQKKINEQGLGGQAVRKMQELGGWVSQKYHNMGKLWINNLRLMVHGLIYSGFSLLYFANFMVGDVAFLSASPFLANFTVGPDQSIVVPDLNLVSSFGLNLTASEATRCVNSSYPHIDSVATAQSKLVGTAAVGIILFAFTVATFFLRVVFMNFARAVVLVGRKRMPDRWLPLLNYLASRLLVTNLVASHHILFGWFSNHRMHPCLFWSTDPAFYLFFQAQGSTYLSTYLPTAYLFYFLASLALIFICCRPRSKLAFGFSTVLLLAWIVLRGGRWLFPAPIVYSNGAIFGLIPEIIEAISTATVAIVDCFVWMSFGKHSTSSVVAPETEEEEESEKGDNGSLELSYQEEADNWLPQQH